MIIGSEKQFYKPLHSQGFKRTRRGREQNYTHVYEHKIPKTNATVIVNLTADQKHVVTYQVDQEFGPKQRFDTLAEMNQLIQDATASIQKILNSDEKHGKDIRRAG